MNMSTSVTGIVLALCELAEHVRSGTLEILHATQRAWLTWTPPGTSNHILWHAGHAVWLQDALTIRPLTGHSELPRSWAAMFGQHSNPEATTNWPDKDEVSTLLETQLARILELLEARSESIGVHPNDVAATGGWPFLAGMIHGWHDEARHQGEMYLLYKMCQAARIAQK
jgi:hypothetical protein